MSKYKVQIKSKQSRSQVGRFSKVVDALLKLSMEFWREHKRARFWILNHFPTLVHDNKYLMTYTGIADVGIKAAKLKWDWAGHTSRMYPDRWAKITTEWVPEDERRRRGRPRKRWRDELDKYEPGWPTAAGTVK